MNTLGNSEIDGLEFYSKDAALDQLQRWVEQHDMEHCGNYGEPGYDLGDKVVIVFGDYWCRCKNHPNAGQLRHRGYGEPEPIKPEDLHEYSEHYPLLWARWEEIAEFEWYDEWYIDYENDKAYRATANSYHWQPSVVFDGEGDMLTPDDDIDVWVEWATDDPTARIIPRHVYGKSELEAIGFSEYNGTYENGWHPGQTDDPHKIVERIHNELGDDAEIVFWLTETSQFYIRFECLVRYPERVYLSSNHFSTDLQLQDVVNYMESEMPDDYARIIGRNPEILTALETITGTSSWIDWETAGTDPELSSWIIDEIENSTDIMWDDGEPVRIVRSWEDDSDD